MTARAKRRRSVGPGYVIRTDSPNRIRVFVFVVKFALVLEVPWFFDTLPSLAIRNAAPLMDQPSSRGARVCNTLVAQQRSKHIPLLLV